VQPPDELMVQQFLPAMRLLVARSLLKQGLPQTRVSSMMGITQASVSHYGTSVPGKAYSALQRFSLSRADADRYAALLGEDLRRDPSRAVGTLMTIWTGVLGRGAACSAHREEYPSLAGCEVCLKVFGETGPRTEAIARVAEAVRLLESSPAFVRVMPEVSVNLACLAGESDAPEDVVAIPGRIVRVKDSARATEPPTFGSSKHLAGVLLLVRHRRPDFRAVINIRYDQAVASVVKRLGLVVLEIGKYSRAGGGDSTLSALREKLRTVRSEFDAVADLGAEGIEPSLYLFARDATGVAELAVRVAAAYSAG